MNSIDVLRIILEGKTTKVVVRDVRDKKHYRIVTWASYGNCDDLELWIDGTEDDGIT